MYNQITFFNGNGTYSQVLSNKFNKEFNDDLYTDFIKFLDAKQRTVETYAKSLKQFFAYLKENNIVRPTRETIIAYKEYLLTKNKATTVKNYLVTVRLFFRWLDQEGLYKNIADKIKSPSISKAHKKDYLTSKQAKSVLETIDTSTETGARDYAIIALMLVSGLRTIEIVRSNIEDVRNVADSTALYIQGKGCDEKADYVKIPHVVENAIRKYLLNRPNLSGFSPLFASTSNNNSGKRLTTRSIRAIVKQRLLEAGYSSSMLSAHSLRHTTATLNLLSGGSLEETQQLLRHSNVNTTMIYLHHIERSKNNSEERIASTIF